MTAGAPARVLVALAVILAAAFALAAHAALMHGLPPSAGALLSLVPLGFLAFWTFRRARHRVLAIALLGAAAAAVAFNWTVFERHFPSVFFLEHAGGNLLLAAVFGRTLAAGREPLVCAFARVAHGGGPLAPDIARYTRRLTLAWTIFFLTLFTVSCVLYFGGFLAAWSLFASLLSPALVGTMFVVEYAIRLRALPNHENVGIVGSVRAFSQHFAATRAGAQR